MIDSSFRVATPDGVSFDLHPAGVMPRLLAFLFDLLVYTVVYTILMVVIEIAVSYGLAGQWLILLISFAFYWSFMVFWEMLLKGRSLGKLIVGLQVVMVDGSPVTLGASVLRNLVRAADSLFAVGLVVPMLNERFQRLGDMVAGTLVVYDPQRLARLNQKLDLKDVEARPPEHLLGPQAPALALAFARRRSAFGPALRRELAVHMADAYLYRQDPDGAERAMLGVAAWYAGHRAADGGPN